MEQTCVIPSLAYLSDSNQYRTESASKRKWRQRHTLERHNVSKTS